jgi:hypothetical protein
VVAGKRCTLPGILLTVLFWMVLVAVAGWLLVAAWPLVIAAGCGFAVAWWRGWPARLLAAGAAWCLPMLAVFALAYRADGDGSWLAAAWSLVEAWQRAWHDLLAGDWVTAMVVIAPAAVPAGRR